MSRRHVLIDGAVDEPLYDSNNRSTQRPSQTPDTTTQTRQNPPLKMSICCRKLPRTKHPFPQYERTLKTPECDGNGNSGPHSSWKQSVRTCRDKKSEIIIIIIIYLFQTARRISQHNIHIEGNKRKERKTLKHLTLKTTRPKRYYAMHTVL